MKTPTVKNTDIPDKFKWIKEQLESRDNVQYTVYVDRYEAGPVVNIYAITLKHCDEAEAIEQDLKEFFAPDDDYSVYTKTTKVYTIMD